MTLRRIFKSGICVALLSALVAASAWAYLTATASGSGSGGVSVTLQALTIAAATGNTQALLPTGVANGDVNATISNPNGSPVHISSLSLDTSQGSSGFSANGASCALGFTTQTNGGSGWTIPASGKSGNPLTVDLQNSVTMGTAAASGCQGQSFSVYLKAP